MTACARAGRFLKDNVERADIADSAVRMLTRACDTSPGASCADVGEALFAGAGVAKDVTRGLKLIENACMAAHAASCEWLGAIYERGRGIDVAAAPQTAHAFYERACHAGAASACDKALALPAPVPPPDPIAALGLAANVVEPSGERATPAHTDAGPARDRATEAAQP
jgi:TPR repeat protein